MKKRGWTHRAQGPIHLVGKQWERGGNAGHAVLSLAIADADIGRSVYGDLEMICSVPNTVAVTG